DDPARALRTLVVRPTDEGGSPGSPSPRPSGDVRSQTGSLGAAVGRCAEGARGATQVVYPGTHELAFQLEHRDPVSLARRRRRPDAIQSRAAPPRNSVFHDEHAQPDLHDRCPADAPEIASSEIPTDE